MKRWSVLLFVLAIALTMAACATGQLSIPAPTLTPTETAIATETVTPTVTETPTPTETPAPLPEFATQMEGTKYSFKDNQVLFSPDNGQATQIASIEDGKFVFAVNGQEVKVDPNLATLPEEKWFLNNATGQIIVVNDETGTYWQYEFDLTTNQWVEKSLLEVSTNINYPTKIEWGDIISGRWAAAVRQAIEARKIPAFTNKVVIEGPSWDNSEPVGKFLRFDYTDRQYEEKLEIRPVIYSAYATVNIGNASFEILTEQIANKSGGFTLVNMKDTKMLKVKTYINDQSIMIGPEMTFQSSDMCAIFDNGGSFNPIVPNSVYCSWFMNGINEIGQEALDNWEKTGDLQQLVEKVIFDVIASRW